MLFRFGIILVGILIGCGNKAKLNDAKFRLVIEKLHECEAYSELKSNALPAEFTESCKQKALSEAQVSREQFEASLSYYRKHPKEFEIIYDSLLKKYN